MVRALRRAKVQSLRYCVVFSRAPRHGAVTLWAFPRLFITGYFIVLTIALHINCFTYIDCTLTSVPACKTMVPNTHSYIHTRTNLPTSMALECWRKPVYPEETHIGKRRTYKLCIGSAAVVGIWTNDPGGSANHLGCGPLNHPRKQLQGTESSNAE